jgi:hypothetical protein
MSARPFIMSNEFKGLEAHSAEWLGDERDYWWNEETTRRYFSAGGGQDAESEANWAAVLAFLRRVNDVRSAGRYYSAGGGLFYVIWGRKPVCQELSQEPPS